MSARRPLVLWQAGVRWDGLPGTDRRLVSELVRHVDVLWVDPSRSAVRVFRDGGARNLPPSVREVSPHLTVVTPIGPPAPYRPGIAPVTDRLVERLVRRLVSSSGREVDLVVSTSPDPHLTVVDAKRRVYYATDDFTAGARLMGKHAGRFERVERRRIAEADVVGAVSSLVLARWDTAGKATFVLPNGCDPAHFAPTDAAPHPKDVALPAPVAGVIGQLSPRIDLSLLEAVADAGISLLLVGPRQVHFEPARLDRLVAHPRVTWVGEKAYDDLPSYMRMLDVGLTPYVDDSFNRASFPLKTLEYLSGGRSVVSTPLPAIAQLRSPWIRTAGTPAEFVEAVRAATSATVDHLAARREMRRFAAQHDWGARARDFLEVVGLPAASDRLGVEIVHGEAAP